MKIIILTSIFFLLQSCTQKIDVLEINDSHGVFRYKDISYYVVSPEDLLKTRKPDGITYVGTVGDYLLFREWLKIQQPNEIHTFAIKRNECLVEKERVPEIEYQINASTGHRDIILKGTDCLVKKK